MIAVFDSNIFVSAFAIPGGRAEDALQKVLDGKVKLLASKAIIHEVLAVLARKFDRDGEELARVAVYISELGEMVHPSQKVKVLDDDADNRILGCALSGKADLIVTGDKAMLKLGTYKDIEIVSLKKFLELC